MQVLLTIVILGAAAAWVLAVQQRLVRLRRQVTEAWRLLEVDQSKAASRNVYNARVQAYNAALETFPAYLIAPLAGLKPARRFDS